MYNLSFTTKHIVAIFLLFLNVSLYAQCLEGTHSTNPLDSWSSCETSVNPNPARGNSHWIQYDLGYLYQLSSAKIWNYNVFNETGKGFKNMTIDYSIDGNTWMNVGQLELPEASGNNNYTGFDGFDFGGVSARYVLLTAIDTWDGGNCAGLSEFKIDVNSVPLPLDLLSFSATPQKDDILLSWESLNESNFSHFEIEKSTDGIHFAFIKNIDGKNQASRQDYQSIDSDVKKGVVYYYRLKMVDLDETFSYSPIRTATLARDIPFTVHPNPAHEILNINIDSNQHTVAILNAAGNEVLRLKQTDSSNQIDISGFPAGVYVCQVVDKNGNVMVKKFVKM